MNIDRLEAEADREEEATAEEYASGKITLEQYNRRVRAIQREVREAIREEEQDEDDYNAYGSRR